MKADGRHERGEESRRERTDEQVIESVRAGDTRQFAELVLRHQDAVYGMARRFVDSAADAEDIAQEVFLRVHRGLEGYKGDARFSTWLYRITWNLCTDWVRRHRKPGRGSVSMEDTGELEDGRAGVEDGLIDEEQRRNVRQALGAMDRKYSSVISLLYYQKLSYEQMAEVLGVPLKTVETRLYRARKLLRARLEQSGEISKGRGGGA
jgi:RNA polymerase sigma factor (sigma-70 family)